MRSPPRSPSPNHPSDVAGNPDASRCFVGRDSDRPAPHGSPDRAGWPDSAAQPAILLEILRRMRHHPENIGVAVFLQDFTGAFACMSGIAVVDTGHGSLPGFSISSHAALSNSSFCSKHYRADDAGSTACAVSQNQPRHRTRTRFWSAISLPRGSPISSRASQIAAALLFDLGAVDVRRVGTQIKANTRRGVFRVKHERRSRVLAQR